MLQLILFLVWSSLHSHSALAQNPDWNRVALESIDSICADTWCAGDYNFRFDSLRCDFKRETCILRYRLGEWPAEGEPMRFSRTGRCQLTGIRSPDDLIDWSSWNRLKDGPYDQITACLP
jgi:hypothetical protein